MVNIGDQVRIKDGSYMQRPNGSHYGETKETKYIGLCKQNFTVLATNLVLKKVDGYVLDTIIQNDENLEVWFCNEKVSLEPLYIREHTMDELKQILGYNFKIKS